MALNDNTLFTTLIFDENEQSKLYISEFDTKGREISELKFGEQYAKTTTLNSVRVYAPLSSEMKEMIKGKDIKTLRIYNGFKSDKRGLSMIKSIRYFDISGQEIPHLFPLPNIEILWAEKADLRCLPAVSEGTKIVNIVDAKLPEPFYINDDCEELRINASDLEKVVIPKAIQKIALVGGTLPKDFSFENYPALKEICFNQKVKLPTQVVIPLGARIDMGGAVANQGKIDITPAVDLSNTRAFKMNLSSCQQSPKITAYLHDQGILFLKGAPSENLSREEAGKGSREL